MTPNEMIQKGVQFAESGNLEEGMKLIDKAISLDPSDPEKIHVRAQIRLAIGEYQGAIADFKKCIYLKDDVFQFHYNLANAYLDTKQPALAVDYYTNAIRINPHDSDIYSNRGNAFVQISQKNLAYSDYKTALSLNPNDQVAKRGLNILLSIDPSLSKLKKLEKHDIDALNYAINHDLGAICFGMVKSKRYSEKQIQDIFAYIAVDKLNFSKANGLYMDQKDLDFILDCTFGFVKSLAGGQIDESLKTSITNQFYHLLKAPASQIEEYKNKIFADVRPFIK
jgi:tetratricopeptide (TPR) repeat protein